MSRKTPSCPQAPINQPWPSHSFESLSLNVRVVTPMFGGGVEPGEADPVTLIRPSSIRGHLRFWWRSTRGAAFETTQALQQRETEIFGDTKHPSPLIVEANSPNWTSRRTCAENFGFSKFGSEAYAIFSAKHNNKDLIAEGFEFQLRIQWPKHIVLQQQRTQENIRQKKQGGKQLPDEIEDISSELNVALDAWLNFGGLGSRTRRGCGAICTADFPSSLLNEKSVRLPGVRVLVGPVANDELGAWARAVEIYQQFRQKQRGTKERDGRSVLEGRSYWPEPNAIRRITQCETPKHSTQNRDSGFEEAFPRAGLGMPIIFWFKDGPNKFGNDRPRPIKSKDPVESELFPQTPNAKGEWVDRTRMASPVITRPVYLRGQWHPAIILLEPNNKLEFRAKFKTRGIRDDKVVDIAKTIPESEIADSKFQKLPTMLGAESAIEGLVNFATQSKFKFLADTQ